MESGDSVSSGNPNSLGLGVYILLSGAKPRKRVITAVSSSSGEIFHFLYCRGCATTTRRRLSLLGGRKSMKGVWKKSSGAKYTKSKNMYSDREETKLLDHSWLLLDYETRTP